MKQNTRVALVVTIYFPSHGCEQEKGVNTACTMRDLWGVQIS